MLEVFSLTNYLNLDCCLLVVALVSLVADVFLFDLDPLALELASAVLLDALEPLAAAVEEDAPPLAVDLVDLGLAEDDAPADVPVVFLVSSFPPNAPPVFLDLLSATSSWNKKSAS